MKDSLLQFSEEFIGKNMQKKIKIVCEEVCKESPYCKQALGGLLKEIKKRRCSYAEVSDAKTVTDEEIVYILGMSHNWIERAVKLCNSKGNTPTVLSNCSKRTVSGRYHYVCTGMYDVMKSLYESCMEAGRTNIALYGIDHANAADMDRMQTFMSLVKENGNIYMNSGNLEACFQTFYPYAEKYDTVICVNGYAAVSLVRKLEKVNPKILERIVVVSCEEVLRNSRYNSKILFVNLNFETFGTTAIQVSELAQEAENILELTVSVKGTICDIPVKKEEELSEDDGEFYEDPEIIAMARIDQLMMESDQQDNQIIDMLLANDTYSEIAEKCFMTEGNVKYRVKKYMTICQVKTKKELLEMLREYLQ